MERTRSTQAKDGYRWVLAIRGGAFVAYPQQRCTTDTGAIYFRFLAVPVAYFETDAERALFIAGHSAKFWALGENTNAA